MAWSSAPTGAGEEEVPEKLCSVVSTPAGVQRNRVPLLAAPPPEVWP